MAEILNIPVDFVEDTLQSIELPDRRQKVTSINGYTVVDDSYNISFNTGIAGIEAAKKVAQRERKKLVIITAGIPELGKENADANIEYGKLLTKEADFVVLLNSILAEQVKTEIKNDYTIVDNLEDAWVFIKDNFSEKDVVILLQPELTDAYY